MENVPGIDGEEESTRFVMSSRLHGTAATSQWSAPNGTSIPMPVIFDLRLHDTETGSDVFTFEATIDLVQGAPAMVRFLADAAEGLDIVRLQREFRWSTPIDVVTRLVPAIIAEGGDPFDHDYPVEGFPEVIDTAIGPANRALSDEFLESIARDYLSMGRGYAQSIADSRGVSRRTVVSWIEKARRRGILTTEGSGNHGGRIVPVAERPPR